MLYISCADKVCASHSVATAVKETVNDLGYNCYMDKIIVDLKDTIKQDKVMNPDEFNKTKIKVFVENKTDKTVKGNINIELRVQTEAASIGDDNQAFNYNPQTELPAGNKMILHWDIGMTLLQKYGIQPGNHAIFAKSFDQGLGKYSCINSKAFGELPCPEISKSRVYAVDYISIIQI